MKSKIIFVTNITGTTVWRVSRSRQFTLVTTSAVVISFWQTWFILSEKLHWLVKFCLAFLLAASVSLHLKCFTKLAVAGWADRSRAAGHTTTT